MCYPVCSVRALPHITHLTAKPSRMIGVQVGVCVSARDLLYLHKQQTLTLTHNIGKERPIGSRNNWFGKSVSTVSARHAGSSGRYKVSRARTLLNMNTTHINMRD